MGDWGPDWGCIRGRGEAAGHAFLTVEAKLTSPSKHDEVLSGNPILLPCNQGREILTPPDGASLISQPPPLPGHTPPPDHVDPSPLDVPHPPRVGPDSIRRKAPTGRRTSSSPPSRPPRTRMRCNPPPLLIALTPVPRFRGGGDQELNQPPPPAPHAVDPGQVSGKQAEWPFQGRIKFRQTRGGAQQQLGEGGKAFFHRLASFNPFHSF